MINYDTLSNEDLLKRVAGGDRGAITFVYDKYAPAIYGILLQNIKSANEADSILCDTFVTFFKSPELHLFPTKNIFIQLRNLASIAIKKRQVLSISSSPLYISFPKLFKVDMQH